MFSFGEGELPFEERQSIEAYQRDVEPLFGEALVGLQGLGLKDASLLGKSHIDSCGGVGVDGYELISADVAGTPLNTDAAKALVGLILMGKGFDEVVDDRDDISDTITWFNTADGGYFSLVVRPGSHTAFGYMSGCRPSDGSSKDVKADRVTLEWESALPDFVPEPTPSTSTK